jgi:hypothetical protein
MSGVSDIEFDFPRPGWFRPGVVIAVVSLILLTAFLLPLPEKMLDVLWICSFCLSGAVAIICLMAQGSSDLIGFIPMVSGAVFLHLMTQASAARHIIRDEPVGILLTWTGSTLASGFPLAAVFISLLLAVISVFVVFTASQRITLASKGYFGQIFPLKRMGIETDLRLGVIDEEQAKGLARRVVSESRFFVAINGVGFLMRTAVVVCICILLMCLIVPVLNNATNPSLDVGLLSAIAPRMVALSIFTVIPALIVAVTCGMLMSRDTLALRTNEPDQPMPAQANKIKVVALDPDGRENLELINPDFLNHRGNEQVVEFESKAEVPLMGSDPVSMDISCRNAKEYYEKLSRVICEIHDRPRVVLLASDRVHSLPVTVALNIAIRLAQKNQKVLLVDTDADRNAVGNVFDLDADSMRKRVQPSSLENLSVCCVPAQKLNLFLRKDTIFDHFSATLIYSPNTPKIVVGKGDQAVKPGAFYFMDGDDTDAGKQAAEKLAFCSWLCLVPSIQSVLDTTS